MVKIGEKKFLKNEMDKLKKIRYAEGITFGEFEELSERSERDKEFYLS